MATKNALLLTCAGGHLAHCLVRALKAEKPGRRIVGADARSIEATSLNASYVVPMPGQSDYIEAIMQICTNEAVSCVLPGSDEEAQALSGALSVFASQGIKINSMSPQQVSFVRDKWKVYEELTHHNVRVPKSFSCNTAAQFEAALKNIGFPRRRAVMRPVTGRGSRNTFIIEEPVQASNHPYMRRVSAPEAVRHLNNQMTMLVSEFIEGQQISVDVLVDHGVVIQSVARACLTAERLPYTGNRLVISDAVDKYVRKTSQILNLHGLLDMDAVIGVNGEPLLIEINPRYSGSIAASLVFGIPLITQLKDMLDGHAVEPIQVTEARTARYDGSEFWIEPV